MNARVGSAAVLPPVTIATWREFVTKPSIFYDLFGDTAFETEFVQYNRRKVNVHISDNEGGNPLSRVILVKRWDDFMELRSRLLSLPTLLRAHVTYETSASVLSSDRSEFSEDLAILVNPTHPLVRQQICPALERARNIIKHHGHFCIELNFNIMVATWWSKRIAQTHVNLARESKMSHDARIYVTNFRKPAYLYRMRMRAGSIVFWLLCGCGLGWMLTAPCYHAVRKAMCQDIVVCIHVHNYDEDIIEQTIRDHLLGNGYDAARNSRRYETAIPVRTSQVVLRIPPPPSYLDATAAAAKQTTSAEEEAGRACAVHANEEFSTITAL